MTATEIKQWQASNGLTQGQAAERLGVGLRTYVRWIQGKGKPGTLAAWAALRRELGREHE